MDDTQKRLKILANFMRFESYTSKEKKLQKNLLTKIYNLYKVRSDLKN